MVLKPTSCSRPPDCSSSSIIVLLFHFLAVLHTTDVVCLLCPGFRERLLADPGFMFKVYIELGIGICTKMSAEYAKRHDTFAKVSTTGGKTGLRCVRRYST